MLVFLSTHRSVLTAWAAIWGVESTATLQGFRRVVVEVDVDVEVDVEEEEEEEEGGGREGMARRTFGGVSWRACRTSWPKEARCLIYW